MAAKGESEKRAEKILDCAALFCSKCEGISDLLERVIIALRILIHWLVKKVYEWTSTSVYNDAAILITIVAKHYETDSHWDDAASHQLMLANTYLQLNNKSNAADAYFDAGKFFLRTIAPKDEDAVSCFMKASNLSLKVRRFNQAANCYKEIAHLHEQKQQWGLAKALFQEAAENFMLENNWFLANKCRLKVAEFAAKFQDYPKAIGIYEDLARQEINRFYNLKEHCFDASLCHLCCHDYGRMKRSWKPYEDHHANTTMQDEIHYLKNLADALVTDSLHGFNLAINEFSAKTTPRRITLLRAKEKSMEEDIKRRNP